MSRPAMTRVPNVLNHPGVMKLTTLMRSIPCSGTPPEIVSTGMTEIELGHRWCLRRESRVRDAGQRANRVARAFIERQAL